MQYSSILYVLFEIKVVKRKLFKSTSRFGGMKMLPRAVCSSTHFALVVIRLWTSWALMMILVYLRIEQSPGSCFLWGCAMLFRWALVWESLQPLGRYRGQGWESVNIVWDWQAVITHLRVAIRYQPCQVGERIAAHSLWCIKVQCSSTQDCDTFAFNVHSMSFLGFCKLIP